MADANRINFSEREPIFVGMTLDELRGLLRRIENQQLEAGDFSAIESVVLGFVAEAEREGSVSAIGLGADGEQIEFFIAPDGA